MTIAGIVAHYITNKGKLKMLIDFREIVGEHSSDNMAETVWATLESYGLTEKGALFTVMTDNATPDDTLMVGLETRSSQIGITTFNAKEVCMQCFPHTTHLTVLKLLEAVGAVKKPDPKSQAAYQETVTVPVEREYNDDGLGDNEGDAEELDAGLHLQAVLKIRRIVHAVRSSPQWHQLWFGEVQAQHQPLMMVILDVCTRWSSTHQMLRCCLDYRAAIDAFVYHNRDLRHLELTGTEWNSIGTVADWLKVFHAATTEMTRTWQSMLSTMHAVFRGLQDYQRKTIPELPHSMPPRLKRGLIEAHRKLSEYYYKSDNSLCYMWAAILDPHIGYKASKRDFADDPELDSLEGLVTRMRSHLDTYYSGRSASPHPVVTPSVPIASSSSHRASPQKPHLTQWYQQAKQQLINEIDVFLKVAQEDFDTCNLTVWWYARRHQFPCLYIFVWDVLAIPGSAVAVERIFSSGRDTIFLRRARLSVETIGTLMIVKQHLRLAHLAVDELTAL